MNEEQWSTGYDLWGQMERASGLEKWALMGQIDKLHPENIGSLFLLRELLMCDIEKRTRCPNTCLRTPELVERVKKDFHTVLDAQREILRKTKLNREREQKRLEFILTSLVMFSTSACTCGQH